MFKNYFKTAWRSLLKNKFYTSINITGLAIGMASSIMLFGYISFQLNYDNFHSNKKNIYRVALNFYQDGKPVFQSAENYPAAAPALRKDFPEVMETARLYNMGYKNNCVFTYNNTSFKETKFLYADASFLTMFSFPLFEGNSATALAEPYTAVISESTARKYFGNQNPIGKAIQMNDDDLNSELCKITGVFKDVPENSHLKFNILISYPTLYHRKGGVNRFENSWSRKDFYTYILLRPGNNPKSLEAKFPSFISNHIKDGKENNSKSEFLLQPLEKIHLNSHLNDEPEVSGNAKAMYFLIIIAIIIIIIAWINYVNLSIASSINRGKEIGIRKVLGSQRTQIIKQFLTESFTINLISLFIAVVLIGLLYQLINIFFYVPISFLILVNNKFGILFLLFLFAGTLLSGLYPAMVLSSFKPAIILKGKFSTSKKGLLLRSALVVVQFSLSIFLIIGTIVVYQQVHYMMNQNIGLKTNQVLVMDRPGLWDTSEVVNSLRIKRFKEYLLKNPDIEAVAMSNVVPGKEISGKINYSITAITNNPIDVNTIGIDEDYINVLGINIITGRNFSRQYKTDENALIITQSAAKLFRFQNPADAVGRALFYNNVAFSIVGIIQDFHQEALSKKAEPVILMFNGDDYEANEYYLVKMKSNDTHKTVDYIQRTWSDVFKGNPFSFFFLDEYFNKQYQNDEQFGILFAIFSIIAIAIACIGLIALVAFMVQQRTKEISIRKIVGAKVSDVMIILTKDFIKLVMLANIIAWPLGYILMNGWLRDFAYRININLWVFVLAGLAAVLIALITVSFQAIKAAIANPVKSLRTE